MWQLELAKGWQAQLSGCCCVGRTRAMRAMHICNVVGVEQLPGCRLCPVMQSKQKQKKMGLANHGLSRAQKRLWNCPARRWCTPCSPACSSCPVGAHSAWWFSVGNHWGGRVLPDQRKWLLLPSRQVTATMPAAYCQQVCISQRQEVAIKVVTARVMEEDNSVRAPSLSAATKQTWQVNSITCPYTYLSSCSRDLKAEVCRDIMKKMQLLHPFNRCRKLEASSCPLPL